MFELGLGMLTCQLLWLMFPSWLLLIFILDPANGPFGIFTYDQSLPKVLQFLLEKFWSGANCFSPVGKCTYQTIHSTLPITKKKKMWRFCFIIDDFSLRGTSL